MKVLSFDLSESAIIYEAKLTKEGNSITPELSIELNELVRGTFRFGEKGTIQMVVESRKGGSILNDVENFWII